MTWHNREKDWYNAERRFIFAAPNDKQRIKWMNQIMKKPSEAQLNSIKNKKLGKSRKSNHTIGVGDLTTKNSLYTKKNQNISHRGLGYNSSSFLTVNSGSSPPTSKYPRFVMNTTGVNKTHTMDQPSIELVSMTDDNHIPSTNELRDSLLNHHIKKNAYKTTTNSIESPRKKHRRNKTGLVTEKQERESR